MVTLTQLLAIARKRYMYNEAVLRRIEECGTFDAPAVYEESPYFASRFLMEYDAELDEETRRWLVDVLCRIGHCAKVFWFAHGRWMPARLRRQIEEAMVRLPCAAYEIRLGNDLLPRRLKRRCEKVVCSDPHFAASLRVRCDNLDADAKRRLEDAACRSPEEAAWVLKCCANLSADARRRLSKAAQSRQREAGRGSRMTTKGAG